MPVFRNRIGARASVSPTVVGGVRAVVEGALLVTLGALLDWVGALDLANAAPWAPVGVLVIRTLEGALDAALGKRDSDVLGVDSDLHAGF